MRVVSGDEPNNGCDARDVIMGERDRSEQLDRELWELISDEVDEEG